ncbi:MAG: RIP metalloprotease RseP [Rickettsiales bacterium]|nr:RIP metalloprotease RseP [Rickettsiales bacterium]
MEILNTIISFLIIMSFIVFIHEFGHFIFARLFKVKVEEFSIGFGKEVFSFKDKKDTKWKFALFPLGGYVKMFGDGNAASVVSEDIYKMSDIERAQSFFFKPLYQKFLIVFAGPLFNYLLGFVIFFYLFFQNGITKTSNVINEVKPGSPAYHAGILSGDEILSINDRQVLRFGDIQRYVQLHPDIELNFKILRDNNTINLPITPEKVNVTDFLGNNIDVGRIGVTSFISSYENTGFFQSINLAVYELYDLSRLTLLAIKQIILGIRTIDDLSGPVKIAKYSSQVTEKAMSHETKLIDFTLIFWFVAIISINLGLANLLPIPLLDGGHLFFYLIQFVTGKEVPVKVQEYAFKLGFIFLVSLFMLITINDIRSVVQ